MRWLAYVTLRVRGFAFEGRVPEAAKFVVVGAPHTSNWDFLVFLAALHHFRIRARYLGKHTLFRWPFGGLMRRLGGIPVRRDRPGSIARDVANGSRSPQMCRSFLRSSTFRIVASSSDRPWR